MPRLNSLEPDRAKGEIAEIYRDLEAETGKVLNLFRGMANSPAALRGFLSLSDLLKSGTLSDQDREVVYLTTSEVNGCNYCLSAHSHRARKAGFDEDEVIAIRQGQPRDSKLEVLAHFTRKVLETRGFVEDSDLEAMRKAGYDDAAITEVAGVIALATFSNYFNHIHGTEIDFPKAVPV